MFRLACVLTTLFTIAFASAAAAATLCEGNEDILFNCNTSKKIISICASPNLTPDHGYIQYRFGLPGKVEVVVPAEKPAAPAGGISYGQMTYSGGGGNYLRFKKEAYDYVIYTAIGKGWGEESGVAIDVNGKRLSHVSCVGEPELSKFNEDIFGKAGIKEDPNDIAFDLP